MNTGKKTLSWGWIIFLLIIFWPVGLILLIRKIVTDKSALMSGKTGALSVVGWILTVLGGITFLAFIIEPEPDTLGITIFSLLFLIGGILLLIKASQTRKTAKKYKKYINIIVNHNEKSIDNIAAAVGVTYDTAIKDLKKMIDIGYLGGAFINQGNREIILKRHEPIAQAFVGGHAAPQMTTVSCSGCGANNVVTVGVITACEYCGSPVRVIA